MHHQGLVAQAATHQRLLLLQPLQLALGKTEPFSQSNLRNRTSAPQNECIRAGWGLMSPSLAPVPQEPLAKTDAQLVAEACGRAAQVLGLNREELSAVVGKHRTSIDRSGLDPSTKEGELALLLLRVYRSLHALCGGDQALMRHWIDQPNRHLGEQPPRLLLARIEGLNRVANYLDALRG